MGELPKDPPAPSAIGIPLPNAIYDSEKYSTRACLFMKDPVDRAVKDEIAEAAPEGFGKVMGYKKLMKNYNEFKRKRELLASYDLFFSDIRIFKMLPKCLGKPFIDAKKYPCPIKLHKAPAGEDEETWSLKAALGGVFKQTYFQMGNGPNYAVKVARVSMNLRECVANVLMGIYRVIPHILVRGVKHTKVQQISLKTKSSLELPVFNHLMKSEIEAYHELAKSGAGAGESLLKPRKAAAA